MKTGQHLVKSSVTPIHKVFNDNEVFIKHLANTSSNSSSEPLLFYIGISSDNKTYYEENYEVFDEVFMRC